MLLQEVKRLFPEIGPGVDAVTIHSRCCRRSDAVELANWQALSEFCAHPWRDDKQTIRLSMVRGEFGQEFVVGYARRGCEAGFGLYLRSDRFGELSRRSDPLQVLRNVEIGFA